MGRRDVLVARRQRVARFIELCASSTYRLATYSSEKLQLEIRIESAVDSENDIFMRRVHVLNKQAATRHVRLFFHQVFQISRSGRGDTALYVPSNSPYVMTYRGDTAFITGSRDSEGAFFDSYAVGNYMIEGKGGTFLDATDGELSQNSVEHGGVDSVIRHSIDIEAGETRSVDYWVAASMVDYHRASHMHRQVASSGLTPYFARTKITGSGGWRFQRR